MCFIGRIYIFFGTRKRGASLTASSEDHPAKLGALSTFENMKVHKRHEIGTQIFAAKL